MTICYIAHRTNLNGASRSLLDLLDGLDRTRYNPVVLVNSKGPLLKELEIRKVPYHFAPIIPSLDADNPVLNALKHLLNFEPIYRLCLSGIKHVIKQIDPDIVHNNTLLSTIGMQAAKDLGIPYICHHRELLWEGFHRHLLREEQDHQLMKDASATISISFVVKNKYQPFAGKEIRVIYDGIHIENYDLPPRSILDRDPITLLLAGRIDKNKGQLDAVKAVELARKYSGRDIRLRIIGKIGETDYANKLVNYITKHDLTYITIETFVPDLTTLRKQCDIGLTCSYFEGLGRVTIENMLSSLLVIAADSAGSLEIVHDGENGILYRTGDYNDLAEKIMWAIEHPITAQAIASNGHFKAIKDYDCRVYAAKVQRIYQELL